jgi:hypothetical protein
LAPHAPIIGASCTAQAAVGRTCDSPSSAGIRIEEPGDVRDGLAEALAHKSGPVVVDAVVDPLALSLPGVYNATSGERSAATNRTLDVSRYINVPMLVF